MSKIRVFIAAGIPDPIKQEVIAWQKKFKAISPGLRPVKPENLHLTLIPPWYEDEKDLKKAEEKFEIMRREFQPFKVAFKKICYGPKKYRPHLIWAVGDSKGEHLTLARFKEQDFKSFAVKEINEMISWEFMINKVCLMRSHLNSQGAEYTILKSYAI